MKTKYKTITVKDSDPSKYAFRLHRNMPAGHFMVWVAGGLGMSDSPELRKLIENARPKRCSAEI